MNEIAFLETMINTLKFDSKFKDKKEKLLPILRRCDINPIPQWAYVQHSGRSGQRYENVEIRVPVPLLDDANREHLNRIMYCISFSYLNDGKDDESLEWINPILSQNEFPQLRAAGYLIKETILKRRGQAEEGRQVLLEFISNPCYEEYLGFAYHNLGCSFKDSGLYDEALDALQTALAYRESPQEHAITKCLMGEIYFKMANYEKAQKLLLEVKDIVFSQCLIEQKEATIAWGFELYWTTRNFKSVLKLLEDVVKLVEDEILPLSIYTNLQNRIYKSIIEDVLTRKEDLNQYRNILDAIN